MKPLDTYILLLLRGMVVSLLFIIFLKRQKQIPTQKLKFYPLKDKQVSILQPKKLEQIFLSPIILSISNIFHEKDNFTLNCMPSKFLQQEQFCYYTALIYNNLCFGNNTPFNYCYNESKQFFSFGNIIHAFGVFGFWTKSFFVKLAIQEIAFLFIFMQNVHYTHMLI